MEICQTEWTAEDVLRQTLEAECIARGQIDAIVDTESRIFPRAHLRDRPLIDLFRSEQELEDFHFPNREQTVCFNPRKTNEYAIRGKAAIGYHGMNAIPIYLTQGIFFGFF